MSVDILDRFPYLDSFLQQQANESTCAKYKVGVLLFGLNTGHIYGAGRNGTPSGIVQCNEIMEILDNVNQEAHTIDEISLIVRNSKVYYKYIELPKKLLKRYNILYAIHKKFPYFDYEYIKQLLKLFANHSSLDIPEFDVIDNFLLDIAIELQVSKREVAKAATLIDTLSLNSKIFELQIRLLKNLFGKVDKFDIKHNYVHSKLELHAERNMLNHLNYQLLNTVKEPLGIYITHTPCFECFKEIYYKLNDKLKVVYYKEVYYHTPYLVMYGSELKEFTHTVELIKAMGVEIKKV